MFRRAASQAEVARGDIRLIFRSQDRLLRYLKAILIGLPLWFGVGIIVTLSPEIARSLGVRGEVNAAQAVMMSYAGIALGDLAFRSRTERCRFLLQLANLETSMQIAMESELLLSQ